MNKIHLSLFGLILTSHSAFSQSSKALDQCLDDQRVALESTLDRLDDYRLDQHMEAHEAFKRESSRHGLRRAVASTYYALESLVKNPICDNPEESITAEGKYNSYLSKKREAVAVIRKILDVGIEQLSVKPDSGPVQPKMVLEKIVKMEKNVALVKPGVEKLGVSLHFVSCIGEAKKL